MFLRQCTARSSAIARRRTIALPMVIAVAFTIASPPPLARATTEDAEAALAKLNDEAAAAFASYSFNRGLSTLDRARSAMEKDSRLATSKQAARSHMLRAIGVIAGKDDLYRGLHYWTAALSIDPKLVPPKELMSPQIAHVLKGARRARKALGSRPPAVELDLYHEKVQTILDSVRKDARGLVHESVDEAQRWHGIPIVAAAGVDIRASSFFIYFRAAGKVAFEKIKMKLSRAAYRATIPKRVTHGRYLHYFVVAKDQRGRVVASHGSKRSPNVITLKAPPKPTAVK